MLRIVLQANFVRNPFCSAQGRYRFFEVRLRTLDIDQSIYVECAGNIEWIMVCLVNPNCFFGQTGSSSEISDDFECLCRLYTKPTRSLRAVGVSKRFDR